jgi:hypothetical protein
VAGLSIGIRSQTAWLTVPLLVFVIADRAGRGAAGALLGAGVTFAVGIVLWAIPMFWATGGLQAYVAALSGQAGEDLSGVDMLATNPTPQRLAAGLVHTFVDPWETLWLAVPVLCLGVAGVLATMRRSPAALLALGALVVPYAAFHLTFHETFTTRYALPLVPVMAYLAVRGLAIAGRLALAGGTAVLAIGSLAITAPAVVAYAQMGSPLARAVADLRTELRRVPPQDRALAMHHPYAVALRDEDFDVQRIPVNRVRFWSEMAKYWQGGGEDAVWFLAEPGPNGLDRHHGLALADRTARRLRRAYRWPFDPTTFVGGARPSDVDWYELRTPGWFATYGWALTPNLAGIARADRRGPSAGGISAFVRRRPGDAVVMVGGRNLSEADGPDVRFDVSIDGRFVRAWRARPKPGFFLELWTLEPGALLGEGRFAELTITAEAADGTKRPIEADVEQFDVQPSAGLVYGFDGGWHEHEYAPRTGRLWRWTSRRAAVRIHSAGRAVRCLIRGESPLLHFDRPSRLELRAGWRLIAELQPQADYQWEVVVPADALEAAGGLLTLATDQVFVPDQRSGNGDHRTLGLRIFEFDVRAEQAHAR